MKFQRGLSLNTLMLGGMVLALLALLAMKAIPPWIEYGNLVKAVKGTATDGSLKDASMAKVREAFTRRADMDDVKSVTAQDLEITIFETPRHNWGFRGLPGDEHALNYRVDV